MNKQFWQRLLDAWVVRRARGNRYGADTDTYICWVAEDVHDYGADFVHDALKEDGLGFHGEGFAINAPETWDESVQYLIWNRKDLATADYTDNDRRLWWLKRQVEKENELDTAS